MLFYMMTHRIKYLILGGLLLVAGVSAHAQFLDSTTGLLQMPTAVMNREGTFMITTNYINQHALSPVKWPDYNTFGYGFDVTLWNRVEVAYVCVLMHGINYYDDQPDVPVYWKNQDRHFAAKLLLLREGDFGKEWLPAVAIGVSDPTTGKGDYLSGVNEKGNGYFNRYYAVATKHFQTNWGEVGAHVGYQFNRRVDIPINAPCAGIDWKPVWIQSKWLSLDLIAEYDSRTFNLGFIASLWDDHIEAMFDLQALKWVSFGLRFKMHLKD